ncbi:MAG: hypothetical protein QM755_22360 [Luteolibacter sp.]
MTPKAARTATIAGGLAITASGPFVFSAAGMPMHPGNGFAYLVMVLLYSIGGCTLAGWVVRIVGRICVSRSKP